MAGLRELTQHTGIPPGAYLCYGGAGSRIDTVATTTESTVCILAAKYRQSTLLSDIHTALLLHVDVKIDDPDKPQPNCKKREPEFHLKEVALTEEETDSLRDAMGARAEHDPVLAPRLWLRELQLAMYEWAKDNDRVIKKSFNQPDMEKRPPQGTAAPAPDNALPEIVGPLDMLPDPADSSLSCCPLRAWRPYRGSTESFLPPSGRPPPGAMERREPAMARKEQGRTPGGRQVQGDVEVHQEGCLERHPTAEDRCGPLANQGNPQPAGNAPTGV